MQPENSGATLATGTFSPPQCEQTKSPREQSLIWERGRRGAVEGGGMQQRSTPAWESSQGCIERRCKENIHLAQKYNSANQAFQFEWEPWTLGLHRNFPSSWATRVCTVWHKGRGRFSFWFWVKRARLPGETARHRHQILNFLPLSRCLAGFGQIHQIWKQFHIEKRERPSEQNKMVVCFQRPWDFIVIEWMVSQVFRAHWDVQAHVSLEIGWCWYIVFVCQKYRFEEYSPVSYIKKEILKSG